MKLFGTSGIRGLANKEVDARLAMKVGNAVGALYGSVVIGHDARTSSEMLSSAVSSGALFSGADVSLGGLMPTPTLAIATKAYGCGVMITASHNPPEYNGIKLWNPDGSAFDSAQMQKVEDLVLKGAAERASWKELRPLGWCKSAKEEHIDRILKSVSQCNFKVVVDCGGGAASVVSPYLFQRMGCDVTAINSHPDPLFSARDPEPSEDSLEVLRKFVVSSKADIGIAHDGDGDRMVAVNEKGAFVSGDRLLALFCALEAVKSIVVPFDASMALEDSLKHIVVHRCRVGDVYVAETIKATGSDFGGEPSGTYIFPKHSMCPDGMYAAARLVELLKKDRLSKLTEKLPVYPTIRKSLPFDPANREKIEERLLKALSALKSQKVDKVDGIRLTFDGSWALIRLSGTEPKVRLTVESRSKKNADETFRKVSSALKKVVK